MELRVLQYFLAVAREESFSKAAEVLHLSQPTLSRQIQDLEHELGKQLIIRGNRKITLTEEGMLLRRRAQEIVDLSEKAEAEIKQSDEVIGGDVYIGAGETENMRLIAKAIKLLQKDYPQIKFHLFSGMINDVTERLDKGLLDFGVVLEPFDEAKYNYIRLPGLDIGGILMRKDSPFAALEVITPDDLSKMPLIAGQRNPSRNNRPNVVGTFNLIYNAALLVEEDVGIAMCLRSLYRETESSLLCFRPLEPKFEIGLAMVWKKYQVFSKAAEKFLDYIQVQIAEE